MKPNAGGPRNLAKVWNVNDIYITENGCSASDVPAADGIVYDTDRIMFLRRFRGACPFRKTGVHFSGTCAISRICSARPRKA